MKYCFKSLIISVLALVMGAVSVSAQQSCALSTQLTSLLGICGSVSIGTNLQGAELVSPAHDGTEVAGDLGVNGGDQAVVDVTGGTVDGQFSGIQNCA